MDRKDIEAQFLKGIAEPIGHDADGRPIIEFDGARWRVVVENIRMVARGEGNDAVMDCTYDVRIEPLDPSEQHIVVVEDMRDKP